MEQNCYYKTESGGCRLYSRFVTCKRCSAFVAPDVRRVRAVVEYEVDVNYFVDSDPEWTMADVNEQFLLKPPKGCEIVSIRNIKGAGEC